VSDALVIVGYELGMLIFLAGLGQRIGRKHNLDYEFNGFYFLKWSFGLAFLVQVGFTVLVSFIYHDRQSVAVALTALIAMPGWIVISGWMQWNFFRRYNRIPNLIKRLERMTAEERAAHLESLPPKVFSQLPGDYRFVSQSSGPGSRQA